jgi:pimeloyl-ACP methyl ester carboxylesterase
MSGLTPVLLRSGARQPHATGVDAGVRRAGSADGGAAWERSPRSTAPRSSTKDWDSGQPKVFSHGCPLSADDWDTQMLFFLQHGYRVIAHDRRGHGRSTQTGDGHDKACRSHWRRRSTPICSPSCDPDPVSRGPNARPATRAGAEVEGRHPPSCRCSASSGGRTARRAPPPGPSPRAVPIRRAISPRRGRRH